MLLLTVFSLAEAGSGLLKDTEGSGITWTSSLDRKIQSLPGDGKEKSSLKRLKHLHQEKVIMATWLKAQRKSQKSQKKERHLLLGCSVKGSVTDFYLDLGESHSFSTPDKRARLRHTRPRVHIWGAAVWVSPQPACHPEPQRRWAELPDASANAGDTAHDACEYGHTLAVFGDRRTDGGFVKIFCASDSWIRVGSCWPVHPQDRGRLWLSASRCSPTCSSRPTLASEQWSSPRPESWPARCASRWNCSCSFSYFLLNDDTHTPACVLDIFQSVLLCCV